MKIHTGYCDVELPAPVDVFFENDYDKQIYTLLYGKIDPSNGFPQIDFDDFRDGSIGLDIEVLAAVQGIAIPASEKDKCQKSMIPFIGKFPIFYSLIKNLSVPAVATIASAESVFGHEVNSENFIEIKKVVDQWNEKRWTRLKGKSESQSGVSVLGGISEKLLETALSSFADNTNFFKNNKSEVQSYGDFVLMCLPNNLWLSVKSNFARERLLASGFTTDIIGVGFFTDSTEFTSGAKLRNFQKVGFLAMYVPDIPITDDQVANNESTFSAIESFYNNNPDRSLPLNINGKLFIRKLSSLHGDLEGLLQEKDVRKRVTIGF